MFFVLEFAHEAIPNSMLGKEGAWTFARSMLWELYMCTVCMN